MLRVHICAQQSSVIVVKGKVLQMETGIFCLPLPRSDPPKRELITGRQLINLPQSPYLKSIIFSSVRIYFYPKYHLLFFPVVVLEHRVNVICGSHSLISLWFVQLMPPIYLNSYYTREGNKPVYVIFFYTDFIQFRVC